MRSKWKLGFNDAADFIEETIVRASSATNDTSPRRVAPRRSDEYAHGDDALCRRFTNEKSPSTNREIYHYTSVAESSAEGTFAISR